MGSTVNSAPPPPGIYVPAVVFYDENEEIDLEATKAHVLRLAKGGVTGILVQGSNGEAQHLSHDERKLLIRHARESLNANGFEHVLVIAGTGAQSTKETKKLCVDAKDAGASHVLVLTPSVWPPQMNKERIIKFHRDVADASPILTMIYNFPIVTAGLNLDSDIIGELGTHPNIVGTKLSCADVGKLHRLTSTLPPTKFATFPGSSAVYLQGLVSGSAGVISALTNVVPKVHVEVHKLWKAGKLQEAEKLQALLGHGEWELQKLGSISGIKAVVTKHFGYGNTNVRGPLTPQNLEVAGAAATAKLEELIALEKAL
ncbi:dihydrodipicolinate synthetase [Pilatotrama ljubarskyi]|nr:dihydrodipicolinate synthetase [Pilatotrama ljubarskyi]